MEGSSLFYVTILPGLVAIGIVVMKVNGFNLSRDLTWPFVQRFVWLNGLNFLIVSHHFGKLSGHRPCGSSDTAAKIVYVASQNHVIRRSGDFIEVKTSFFIPTLPKLIAIVYIVLRDR